MADHPYRKLPPKAFWRKSVAGVTPDEVDPVGAFKLRILPETKVATAGSCFAQHIARHLKKSGFLYYIAEEGHPVVPLAIRERHNYGMFSARYGNIYTARQLLQLFDRAYGAFVPEEPAWVDDDGTVRDPFRPTVQPGNFISEAEMLADRRQHLSAVRRMFETLDVFVFTLGLTESWKSKRDGAVFPLCPGVEGGSFDIAKYAFENQSVKSVTKDMTAFFEKLRAVNPKAQAILTVSPVPLMATAVPGAQVLSATTYSKSVLRVSAQLLCDAHDFVHYFPSYEVIAGAYNRGRYYAEDLRNVTEEGVSHVMRLFLRHAAGVEPGRHASPIPESRDARESAVMRAAAEFVEVECDEVALGRD
jgi:hypothetical protein